MNIQEHATNVPDVIKVAVATGSTALTFFGIPVEQWMYILSGIVSIMFIIEKLPTFFKRIKEAYGCFKR